MTPEKQIEEMARTMCGGANDDCIECNTHCGICEFWTEASILYNAGYRKATDVAREILEKIHLKLDEEIERNKRLARNTIESTPTIIYNTTKATLIDVRHYIAELKNKYESEGNK